MYAKFTYIYFSYTTYVYITKYFNNIPEKKNSVAIQFLEIGL